MAKRTSRRKQSRLKKNVAKAAMKSNATGIEASNPRKALGNRMAISAQISKPVAVQGLRCAAKDLHRQTSV